MKRANGTGTIKRYKDKPRRPWGAFKPAVYDSDGKAHRELIGYFATKAEAEQALSLEQIRPSSELRNITLDSLFNRWKKTRAYTDLSRSTQLGYDAAYKYMTQYATTKFADLRQPHFQACIDSAINQGKSVATQHKIKVLCGILSQYALVNDITFKSYAIKLRTEQTQKKDIPVFSDMDIKTLFDNDKMPLVDTILILIYTGMRISELLTLNKFQVNLNDMILTGGLKTDAGKDRVIPIHPKIAKYIIARYDRSHNKLIEWEYKGEVRAYTYEYYRKQYYKVLSDLNIKKISPHKARHTFFSLMDRYCQDKKAMADIGGHADSHFTENVYVHSDLDRLKSAINSIP